jgi:hypothetical protein
MEHKAKIPDFFDRLFWITILGFAGIGMFIYPSIGLGDRWGHYAVISIISLIAVLQIIGSVTRIKTHTGSRVSLSMDYFMIAASLIYLAALLIRLLQSF